MSDSEPEGVNEFLVEIGALTAIELGKESPVDLDEFPLAGSEAIHTETRPWWLVESPPAKLTARQKFHKWPKGAWSPSRFKVMKQCPRRMQKKYGKDKIPDPTGLDGLVGNAFHGAAEDAGRRRLGYGRRAPPPRIASPAELMHLLEYQKEVVTDEGTEVLARARDLAKAVDPGIDFGNLWSVEHVWSFPITPAFFAAGIADMIQLVPGPDPSVPSQVIIVDYKTGPGQLPTHKDLKRDPQAVLQLIWGTRCWPQSRITFKIWNVLRGEKIEIDYDPEDEQVMLAFTRGCLNMWSTGFAQGNPGTPHCKHCPYRSDCPDYRAFAQGEGLRITAGSLESLSIPELIFEYKRSQALAVLNDTRRKDCGALLIERIPKGQKSYMTANLRATKKTRRSGAFHAPVSLIEKISSVTGTDARRLTEKLMKIGSRKLQDFVGTVPIHLRPEVEALVDEHQSLNESKPWIEVRETEPLL